MELKLKNILDGAQEAVITLWHTEENAMVKKGQDLLEIATDKATFDVACPAEGILVKICKKAGENIHPDETLAEIE